MTVKGVGDELLDVVTARRGHFHLESGHHGDLWLDLELLCVQPARVERFAAALAGQIAHYGIWKTSPTERNSGPPGARQPALIALSSARSMIEGCPAGR